MLWLTSCGAPVSWACLIRTFDLSHSLNAARPYSSSALPVSFFCCPGNKMFCFPARGIDCVCLRRIVGNTLPVTNRVAMPRVMQQCVACMFAAGEFGAHLF